MLLKEVVTKGPNNDPNKPRIVNNDPLRRRIGGDSRKDILGKVLLHSLGTPKGFCR